MKTFNNRKEKMPTKVMYNIDAILSPHADPKKHIALGPSDKNRISRSGKMARAIFRLELSKICILRDCRSRTKLSPSPSSKESSKCVCVSCIDNCYILIKYISLNFAFVVLSLDIDLLSNGNNPSILGHHRIGLLGQTRTKGIKFASVADSV